MKMENRTLEVGDAVVFIDSQRRRLNALVQCVHGDITKGVRYGSTEEVWSVPCINIVVVSTDPNRDDSYGRQIEHFTSVSHWASYLPVVGNVWYWPDEDVTIDHASVATKK